MANVTKRYDVTAVTGSYTGRDGTTKNNYTRIGTATEFDGGGMLLEIVAIPINWNGKASLFLQKPREDQAQTQPLSANGNSDDDLPF